MSRCNKNLLVLVGLVVALFSFASSCGGKAKGPSAGSALSFALVVQTKDGSIEARASGGDFAPLAQATHATNVIEARGVGAGGAFDLVDGDRAVAKIWLSGSTSIALGEEEGRRVRIVLENKGEMRVRALDPSLDVRVATNDGTVSLDGRDLLFEKRGEVVTVADVARHLEAAEWSFALEAPADASGVGTMEAKVADPSVVAPPSEPPQVKLVSLRVTGKTTGDVVETEVEHVFHNESALRLEGTFRFPMPPGAVLVGLAMEIDGKLMEGSLVEEYKAEKIYENIVDHMRDPALLQWEQGTTFKLRVFPIEGKSDKRVVLRYLAPLRRGVDGAEFVYSTSAPGMQSTIPFFHVELDGKTIFDGHDFAPGTDVVANVASPPNVVREVRADGVYTLVHVTPDWAKIPAPNASSLNASRRMIVVVDTSRSTLEERPLELDALRTLLGELRPMDRFLVVTADVSVRAQESFVAPNEKSIADAAAFVDAIDADGASDVGLMMTKAAELVKRAKSEDGSATTEVVYLGDGVATWGETDAAALEKKASEVLGATSLHAMILGKATDGDAVRDIATRLGGRVVHPRTALEAKEAATSLVHATEEKRLARAYVVPGEGELLYPDRPTTLFDGDELVAVVKTPKGATPSSTLTLVADGYAQPIALASLSSTSAATPHVAQRWAVERIDALEREGDASRDEVIKTSLDFGVMSKHTSFLVLESEEMYAQFDIARKAAKQGDPSVSGDLDALGPRTASLEPDHLQPGDPEVRIFAPSDAQSVVVVLPFGETKVARFEQDLGAWTVRFLVDDSTPDGTYEIVVRITHADGSIEVQRLEYVVDTQKPSVTLELVKKGGAFEIRAKQEITAAEVAAAIPDERRTLSPNDDAKTFAAVLTDLKRVEVRTPDGQAIALTAIKLGEFRGAWSPSAPIDPSNVTLHVVAADRALNERVFDVIVGVAP